MEFFTLLAFLGLVYAMLTTSYRLLMGVAGQFSVAHAAMWGMGAYASSYVTLTLGWPVITGLPVGLIFGALAGALVALPALRVSGVYLAIVTFAFQLIFVNLLKNLTTITGGSGGLPGIPGFEAVGPLTRSQVITIATALCLAAVVWLVRLWSRGPYGLVLHVSGRAEDVLESMGRDTRWLKIQVFAISGGIAGLAGVFYAHYISFIGPESFTVHFSILLMSMMLIGGASTTAGPLVGAAIFVLAPELLHRLGLPGSVAAPLQQILFGLLLIVFLIFRPLGVVTPRRRAGDLVAPVTAPSMEGALPATVGAGEEEPA